MVARVFPPGPVALPAHRPTHAAGQQLRGVRLAGGFRAVRLRGEFPMKRVPISECPAGPWLDAAVAKAIGYEVNGASVDDTFYPAGCIKSGEFVSFNRNLGAWWSPSTDITAAWELVEEGDLLVENF